MNDLKSAKSAMDEGGQVSMSFHGPPAGPRYINEVVDIEALGPKPDNYMELADTGADHNNLHISETYCFKCQHILGAGPPHKKHGLIYDIGINNHVFSDRAQSARVHAKDGWVRVERTMVAAHRREWRTGKRDAEPENETCSMDKLERRLKAQLHAGAMPRKLCRRPSLAKRGEKLLKLKSKARQKAKHVSAACKALRAKAKA